MTMTKDDHIRRQIEAGAREGNGACLIAYAILVLARVHDDHIADRPNVAEVGGKIAKAVEACADRLAEVSDTILCK